jgi:hypothetical protein
MWGFHFRQMIWEEGLRRLVSVPWQHICSLFFLPEFLAKK